MRKVINWMDRKLIAMKMYVTDNNAGFGTVEVVLLIVVIFTIYKGCK